MLCCTQLGKTHVVCSVVYITLHIPVFITSSIVHTELQMTVQCVLFSAVCLDYVHIRVYMPPCNYDCSNI